MPVLLLSLTVAALGHLASQATPQPRDARSVQTGTAIIRGQVTELDTGVPLARVTVRLRSGALQPVEVLTDERGRFEFTRLAAGEYRLFAEPRPNRSTHLPGFFESQPPVAGQMRTPSPIVLADGELREKLNIVLSRPLAIAGRVVDEFGDPLTDIMVSAEPLTRSQTFVSRSRQTDDRGMFRVFGLPAGLYRLCADAGGSFNERTTQALVRTCYPSTVIDADSSPLTLATSDLQDIEIQMQRGRMFTVSGTILDASGAPATNVSANIFRFVKNLTSGTSLQVDSAGRFSTRGLPPGDYAIHVEIGGMLRPDDVREAQVAHVEFTLDVADVENLVLTMVKPARVAGRVSFEDGQPPRAPELRVRALESPELRGRSGPPSPAARVRDDLTFELTGLYGPRVVVVEGAPREWIVKTVRYRGQSVTGLPVDFTAGTGEKNLEVVLSTRAARVVARVVDDRGNMAAARVYMFPADARQWPTRSNFTTTGARDGVVTIGPVRAGEYFIIAVSPETPGLDDYGSGFSRERIEAFAKAAERIMLAENEERPIELRLAKVQ